MSSEAGAQLSPRAVALVEAVLGVLGPREGGHPLHEPSLGEAEASLVAECVRSGWVSSVGAHVDGFEAELAARCGREHAVATSTGTAALHVALLLAGVEPGDEVLCPSLTFVATANAVRYCNATPHFVEAEERTLGVDPGALARHLAEAAVVGSDGELRSRASGARIRALVVTHIFGAPRGGGSGGSLRVRRHRARRGRGRGPGVRDGRRARGRARRRCGAQLQREQGHHDRRRWGGPHR